MLNQRLGLGYRASALSCDVVLVRARRQGLLVNALADDLGWRPVCEGAFSVFHVGCGHQDLVSDEYAGEVAGAFATELR
ncbi:MAG: hypothetical protein P8J87_11645 [Verrucomicrobiales bacterium]|nr:hypothetical protein [Verrucomicrobiales bacterium]